MFLFLLSGIDALSFKANRATRHKGSVNPNEHVKYYQNNKVRIKHKIFVSTTNLHLYLKKRFSLSNLKGNRNNETTTVILSMNW